MPQTKTCRICADAKPLDAFEKKREGPGGACKKCARTYKQYQIDGRLMEFWEEYADLDESPLKALKRRRVHDPESHGLWQLAAPLAEKHGNVKADTLLMKRFTGGTLT